MAKKEEIHISFLTQKWVSNLGGFKFAANIFFPRHKPGAPLAGIQLSAFSEQLLAEPATWTRGPF